MNLKAWVSDLNTTAFSSATSQFCWIFGSVVFTLTDCALLWWEKSGGLPLALALIAGWTGKSVAGVVDKKNAAKANVELAKATNGRANPLPSLTAGAVAEQEWATGDPKAGLL